MRKRGERNREEMTHQLSTQQVKNLHKRINEVTSKSQIREIFVKYFPKVFDEEKKDKPSKKSAKTDNKSKQKNAEGSGYRIIWVSDKLDHPTSKYKKETPMDAATSAMNGILRKQEWKKNDATFAFVIQDGDGPKYIYILNNGKLNRVSKVAIGQTPNSTSDLLKLISNKSS